MQETVESGRRGKQEGLECDISADEPSIHEIKAALKQVKNRKYPGKDRIPTKILMIDIDTMAHILHPVFQEIWKNEKIPADWKMV